PCRVETTDTNGSQNEKAPSDAGRAVSAKPGGVSAVAVLWTFGKCLGALLPVYLAGYYRVSTSLLVCGMMVYTGWKHAREAKEERLRSAIRLLDDEEDYASTKVSKIKRDLPAWVNFPDVEKVEWLNKVLQQVWPFVGQYMEKLLVETIAPSLRASSNHLQTLSFTKVDMGDKAMKVVGIKAHTENDKGQVLLDLYISYVGNAEINVEVKRYFCKAGVKGIQLHGMMRVILEPLIGDVPIVGAVTMFFIRRPKLDINWTGLTNLLDVPGLNVMSDSMIMDAIASFLVLPNRLVVPLVPGLHVAQLRCPLPRGVVRIHLLEAQNLAAKDSYVKGVMAGLSDPYAILRVGPQTFTSKHIDNTDSPKWGEMYEVIVHEVPGQELEVEVYDKDPDKDDFLGRTTLDLGIVKKCIAVDDWFTLKETSSGRVHFRLEWLALLPNTEQLEQVLKRNESVTSTTSKPPSSAILVVYLDKAEALPMKKGNKEPNPMVQISVQNDTRDSKICYTTVSPEWEEAFTFFIQDPQKQDISVQVKDATDRAQTLGSLTIPLSRLLANANLSLDQWFQLENSGSASRIYVNAVLRGLLRIHLLAGQNLIPKDNLMGGMVKGKSDPYVKINIGGETFTSQVIKGNLNPTWNEMYELPGQDLRLEVFDKDVDIKDDFMGRLKISLKDIIDSQYIDQSYQNKAVPSAGLLFVFVEQADGLPVCDRTTSPKWNEAFCFRLRDPRDDVLIVKLSHSWTLPLGSLVVPIRELLSEPELVLDQWFHLDGASPESQILLRTELKMEESPSPAITQPPHTSPDLTFASEGLLRIILLEAQSLIAKDNLMGGMKKGKSDPYAKISVGEVVFKSAVVKENLDPVWNELYEVVLRPSSGQDVQLELYDKDMDKDDFLACLFQWFTLNDVKSGRVRLILEWVPTVSHNDNLDQVMQLQSLQSYQNKAVPSAALLFVYVDRAHSLPFKKSGKEPKAGAELVFGGTTYRTQVCDRSRSPQWSEAFHFVVHDPKDEMLIVKLSSAWDQPMGSLVLPVRALLSEQQLVLDQWMHLDGALPESEILLRADCVLIVYFFHFSNIDLIFCQVTEEPTKKDEHPTQSAVKGDFDPPRVQTERCHYYELDDSKRCRCFMVACCLVPVCFLTPPFIILQGVLRIHLLEAQNLVAKDNLMGGMVKGKSDPYVKISVGSNTFKSHVIKENLNPTWNEMYEVVLSGHSDQDIKFEAFDKDMDSDDFLGRFSVKLSEVIRSQYTDQVLQLPSLQSYQNKAVPSAALLFVYIEAAHSLPLCDRSANPQWEESFYFLIQDPKRQILVVKARRAACRTTAGPGPVVPSGWSLTRQSDLTESRTQDYSLRVKTVLFSAHRGLLSQSKDGIDSYVSLMLLPDKSKATKKKTAVKKKDLNPEFNERFEYDLPEDETRFRRLGVSVKNNSASFRSRDVVGQVQIDLAQIDLKSGITDW
uniref:Extended synaptotagmin-like protein 1b n=1 Tax=Kryptolebias marmoratus TaxID=37003 RepID=A0A3Q3BH52_KRYMA